MAKHFRHGAPLTPQSPKLVDSGPLPVRSFTATRADGDGVRLQFRAGDQRHDMALTSVQALALAAELARITEFRNRNYSGPR